MSCRRLYQIEDKGIRKVKFWLTSIKMFLYFPYKGDLKIEKQTCQFPKLISRFIKNTRVVSRRLRNQGRGLLITPTWPYPPVIWIVRIWQCLHLGLKFALMQHIIFFTSLSTDRVSMQHVFISIFQKKHKRKLSVNLRFQMYCTRGPTTLAATLYHSTTF